MATLIKGKDLKFLDKLGNPGSIQFGIDDEKVENPKMMMGHTVTPPAFRGRRHYHANCNVGMYNVNGHRRFLVGPDHDMQEIDLEPGDFVFMPQGEIHGVVNLSDTEPSELVWCYIGVNNKKEAKTIFVDPPSEHEK
jgi:uncharacterized RmlC-like cupin family protein